MNYTDFACLNRHQISRTLIVTVVHLRMELKKDYGHNFNSKKVKIENNNFVGLAILWFEDKYDKLLP